MTIRTLDNFVFQHSSLEGMKNESKGGMVELVAELLIKQFLPLLFACYNYKVRFKIERMLSEAHFLEWEGTQQEAKHSHVLCEQYL